MFLIVLPVERLRPGAVQSPRHGRRCGQRGRRRTAPHVRQRTGLRRLVRRRQHPRPAQWRPVQGRSLHQHQEIESASTPGGRIELFFKKYIFRTTVECGRPVDGRRVGRVRARQGRRPALGGRTFRRRRRDAAPGRADLLLAHHRPAGGDAARRVLAPARRQSLPVFVFVFPVGSTCIAFVDSTQPFRRRTRRSTSQRWSTWATTASTSPAAASSSSTETASTAPSSLAKVESNLSAWQPLLVSFSNDVWWRVKSTQTKSTRAWITNHCHD